MKKLLIIALLLLTSLSAVAPSADAAPRRVQVRQQVIVQRAIVRRPVVIQRRAPRRPRPFARVRAFLRIR